MDDLHELVDEPYKIRWKRGVILKYLRNEYPKEKLTISLWARSAYGPPGSCTLKGGSRDLAGELDIARLRCLEYSELTQAPNAPHIVDPNVRADLATSRQRIFAFIKAMYDDHAHQARGVVAILTLSGKLLYKYLHIVCLRGQGDQPWEYVAAAKNIKEGGSHTISFGPCPDLGVKLHTAWLNTRKKKTAGAEKPKEEKEKWAVGNPESAPAVPMCTFCGQRGSIQMRLGPQWLCNACGVQFAKAEPLAAAEDGSPPILPPDYLESSEPLEAIFAGELPAAAAPPPFFQEG